MYCNWLSAREGLAPSEWVYPAGVLRDGFELPSNYLRRRGYRLPTEPEWEFAARAGSSTSRFFGNSDAPLGEYAWFARHPPRTKDDPADPADPQRTARVGLLKPNPLGLFDIYGNVWEWTQDRVERFQTPESARIVKIQCCESPIGMLELGAAARSPTARRSRDPQHAGR